MNRLLVVLGLCGLAAQPLLAGVVFQQPPVWSGNGTVVGSAWTSQSDAGLSGFRTFDNFSLGSPALINQATWLGIYIDSATLSDSAPNTLTWIIRFQADNSGIPGATLQSTNIASSQVNTTILGTGLFNGNTVTVYQFTADVPAFSAAAGTTYWFSPLSLATTFDPLFAMIEGAGGDGASFQTSFNSGVATGAFVRGADRAFELSSVPEPAAMVLLGPALAFFAFVGRRATR